MHALVYHVPVFVQKHKNFKQFTGQGIEKNNYAKRMYFQKSNKWDAARDILLLEHRQRALRHHEREKRTYQKRNWAYWDEGIIENRKKRAKACLRDTDNDGGSSSSSMEEEKEDNSDNFSKMTVKQLRQELKARNRTVKGIKKMVKSKLIEILQRT